MPQDRALGWGWIPLGRTIPTIDWEAVARRAKDVDPGVRVAAGTPGSAVSGFRSTHSEALRAHAVATVAAERALHVTAYADPGVRAAALLARDLPMTRELVVTTLGGLAADDESTERLRSTLLTFLSEKGSYRAASERTHLHRNTVKYRVDKAIEARGRGLDDDRLNLELALLACQWLGRAVFARAEAPGSRGVHGTSRHAAVQVAHGADQAGPSPHDANY
jgi:sugar diacid utilization regulator